MPEHLNMLLVEEQALLRKTVSLTARSLGLGTIHEAATMQAAERMLREQTFHGAVISLDCGTGQGDRPTQQRGQQPFPVCAW